MAHWQNMILNTHNGKIEYFGRDFHGLRKEMKNVKWDTKRTGYCLLEKQINVSHCL